MYTLNALGKIFSKCVKLVPNLTHFDNVFHSALIWSQISKCVIFSQCVATTRYGQKADLFELKKFAYRYRSYFKHSFGYQINVFALEGVVKLTWDRQTDRRLHMQVKKNKKVGEGSFSLLAGSQVLEDRTHSPPPHPPI